MADNRLQTAADPRNDSVAHENTTVIKSFLPAVNNSGVKDSHAQPPVSVSKSCLPSSTSVKICLDKEVQTDGASPTSNKSKSTRIDISTPQNSQINTSKPSSSHPKPNSINSDTEEQYSSSYTSITEINPNKKEDRLEKIC